MSTIGVAGIERVAALVQAERPDVTLLDAPVSGSKDPAEHGQLTIFASGPDEVRARVAPLFDALGQRTIWVGAGRGWIAAEAGEQHVARVRVRRRSPRRRRSPVGWGSRPRRWWTRSRAGPLVSPWQAAKLQRIAHGEFSAQFALSLALKDVHLALQAAERRPLRRPRLSGRGVAAGCRSGARRPGPHRRDPRARSARSEAVTLVGYTMGYTDRASRSARSCRWASMRRSKSLRYAVATASASWCSVGSGAPLSHSPRTSHCRSWSCSRRPSCHQSHSRSM